MPKPPSSLLRRAPRRSLQHAATSSDSVQITTLPNKIRVATESTPGHFSSLGLYVDAGSRYETNANSGVSHFLDRMAFKSTTTRSDLEMATAMDKLGGQIMCSSSREAIMYQSSHFQQATPQALSLISDTVCNPSFLQDELEAQRDAARYEIREVSSKPEMILPEILHEVAYNHKTLGMPLLCPENRVNFIDDKTLRSFMKEWYRPERMVIAAAGVQHDQLVELVDKYFSGINASPSTEPATLLGTGRATYTGGHRFIHDPESEFDHLYVGFEGVGIHDDDVYTLATMQVLLGGGGSFSAGGPGKGMYSRLYTHILNHYPQIDHCASFHHIYTDSALFGLYATFVPNTPLSRTNNSGGLTPQQVLPHLVHQLSLLLYSPLPDVELKRAKNQLKSSLVMALESRSVEVEDLGRQILVHNRKIPVSEMCARIDEVDHHAIRRVANRIFGPESKNKATVVVMGNEDVDDYKMTLKKYGVGGYA
ncbi:peptidase M16 family protein [Abortiporus biennis]